MKKLIKSREEFVEFISSFEFEHCHMSFDWPEQYPVMVIHRKDDNHAYKHICAYFDYVYTTDFIIGV